MDISIQKAAAVLFSILIPLLLPAAGQSQIINTLDLDNKVLIVMGDSISEGVQSGNASLDTQLYTYGNFLASHLNMPLAIPYIQSNYTGVVGSATGRNRLNANVATNIAVSGADVNSLLNQRNDALTAEEINSETDMVLFPWLGSQMEVAEYITANIVPTFVLCWIGNNDVLSAVTSFDQLDASQMTTVEEFQRDFTDIVIRLHDIGSGAVLANIPDVTSIAFLLDNEELTKIFGINFNLPEGSYTTIAAAMVVKLGLFDNSIFQDPNYILDENEIAAIRERTAVFNTYIAEMGVEAGFPVVDINSKFNELALNPPVVADIQLSSGWLGGLFSLDGVHPSNTGHILITTEFINTINNFYGTAIPQIAPEVIDIVVLSDPHVDKDGDGRVTGRFGTGLLETMGPFLGLSGDLDDFNAEVAGAASDNAGAVSYTLPAAGNKAEAARFVKEILGVR
ncbi:MAG: SGNH/GDSL hydrolase family protein [Nitrospira sp.]|nr:SGNH/GDSL hydrolase family protein [bacterium]MBL7050054.1 SGNH/GDSL hydrolase family protein [Nitrospira sp.]